MLRIILKAALLFGLCNALYSVADPTDLIGRLSLYNVVLPGRARLPYGENPAESYNLSLYNFPAMFASHKIARPKAGDEYRVVLLGDSGVWGWLLENRDTLAGIITAQSLMTHEEQPRRIVAYNFGYPEMALSKDLLLLDYAMQYQPDLIVWPVTLQSFPRDQQLAPYIVQNNAARMRALIARYPLDLNPDDSRLVEPDFFARTLVGQRRDLADRLRLQLYGFSWAATGIDQAIPAEFPLRQSDFEADVSWQSFQTRQPLTADDLAFDVLEAGIALAGSVPVLLVNEPIYVSDGLNSDLRYNTFYPRWAYDSYRVLLADTAAANGWHYRDVWDLIDPDEFTDTPVHLTPRGSKILAQRLGAEIRGIAEEPTTNG